MKILNIAKIELSYLEKDFKHLVKNTKKPKKTSFEKKFGIDPDFLKSLNELERKEIDNVRKDRKYAAFIVEIYSLVEQTLDKLYKKFYKKPFIVEVGPGKKPKNKALELEEALDKKLQFECSVQDFKLIKIRNKIVHESFSVKEVKELLGLNKRSKDLIQELIEDVNKYLNGISK